MISFFVVLRSLIKRLTESRCREVIADLFERTIGEPLAFRTARVLLSKTRLITENVAPNFGCRVDERIGTSDQNNLIS
jgi:hypothetical protein